MINGLWGDVQVDAAHSQPGVRRRDMSSFPQAVFRHAGGMLVFTIGAMLPGTASAARNLEFEP